MAVLLKPKPEAVPSAIEEVLCSPGQIAKRLDALGREITKDYQGRSLTIVGILKGSFMFLSDLVRKIKVPLEIDFLSVSSYAGTHSTGFVRLNFDIKRPIKGRNVLLVDDIVDTGFSLAFARKHLLGKEPRTLEVCVLLDKPERRRVLAPVRYTGFTIADRFVVGYGLDYNEHFRELPYIGVLKGERLEP